MDEGSEDFGVVFWWDAKLLDETWGGEGWRLGRGTERNESLSNLRDVGVRDVVG